MILGKLDNKNISKKVEFSVGKIGKITKLALMSTLAGYNKSCNIALEEPFLTSSKKLEDFINFLLNHKGFAPINYNIRLNFLKGKKLKLDRSLKNRKIVLTSGGIDSTAAIFHYLDIGVKPLLISLDFGQINNQAEQKVIKSIVKKLGLELIVVKINIEKEVVNGWKEWSYIVPARNLLIAAIAADLCNHLCLSGTIAMVATSEEVNDKCPGPDKSPRFYSFCTNFFSKEYNRKLKLLTPFARKTKAEMLSIWRTKWQAKYGISPYETTTCYSGEECGECNSCFKRSLALLAAGFNLDPKIKSNPFLFDINKTANYLSRIGSKTEGFPLDRRIDNTLAFMRAKKLGMLPSECLERLSALEKKYKKYFPARLRKFRLKDDFI